LVKVIIGSGPLHETRPNGEATVNAKDEGHDESEGQVKRLG